MVLDLLSFKPVLTKLTIAEALPCIQVQLL